MNGILLRKTIMRRQTNSEYEYIYKCMQVCIGEYLFAQCTDHALAVTLQNWKRMCVHVCLHK